MFDKRKKWKKRARVRYVYLSIYTNTQIHHAYITHMHSYTDQERERE